MFEISKLRELCHDKNIAITKHAKDRLTERSITIDDIKNAIKTGRIIEQYEDDKPFKSCLVLGFSTQNKHMHIVASLNSNYLYIITAYYPDSEEWENDFITRKGR